MMIAKPSRADRLVEKAERRKARRSGLGSGLTLAKPEVWHCAPYRAWAREHFDCAIKGRPDHTCGPKVDGRVVKEFCHAEPEGRGLKSSDHFGIVLCSSGHREQTVTSWSRFQRKYGIDRRAIARRMFDASPWASRVEVVWK